MQEAPVPGPDLEADCSRCVGLCCVALSFQRSDDFGHDKLAGEPCHHLDPQFRCRIHARREELGYDGCEAFDCLGAGQRASALFAGENWRRDPAVARRLHAGFAALMQLQEMRRALLEAAALPLELAAETERRQLLDAIAERADSPRVGLDRDAPPLLAAAGAFLDQLRPVFGR